MADAFRSLVFIFSLLLISSGRAQTPVADQSVRFTVFCTRPASGLAFVAKAGAVPVPLVFYPTARSPRCDYRGPMPLALVDARTLEVVAEVTIPSGLSEALLILVPVEPAENEGRKYRVFVLDDSDRARGAGSLAIINFSGLELAGTWEGKPIALAAGLNPVRAMGGRGRLSLRTPFKSRSYQAYAGEVAVGKGERALLLLFPPLEAGSLEVQSRLLTDTPPVPAP